MTTPQPPTPFVSSIVETPIGSAPSHGVSTGLDTNGKFGAEGHRLHISGLLVGFVTGLPQLVFPIVAAVFGGARASNNPLFIPAIIVIVLFASLFFRWLAWMRFRYHIGEDDIRIESGILSRNARSIPYERIQDVSIEQKPLARIMGLGEVKFETGGGDGDEAKLSFVSMPDAENLRELVRARKSGIGVVEQEDAVEQVDTPPIFAMDGRRVFTLGLYSFSLFIFAILGGLAQQFDAFLPFELWDFRHWIGMAEDRGVSVDRLNGIGWTARFVFAAVALTALLFVGFASGVIRTTLKEHGFRLDRTDKGFRRRRGLLTLTDVVMPAHRVQAAVIQTGPIRRRRGWHALKFVSLAQDSKDESNYVAAPFATLEEIWRIAQAARIEGPDGDERLRKGAITHWMTQLGFLVPIIFVAMAAVIIFADASFARSTALLLLLAFVAFWFWLDWRKYRFGLDDDQIYVRRGWWQQSLTIAPQVKVQSVEIAQGPISRRQGLASLKFGIAGGTLEMVAVPLAIAHAICDAVMEKVAVVDYSAINQSR